jgi:hypothetical protein
MISSSPRTVQPRSSRSYWQLGLFFAWASCQGMGEDSLGVGEQSSGVQ